MSAVFELDKIHRVKGRHDEHLGNVHTKLARQALIWQETQQDIADYYGGEPSSAFDPNADVHGHLARNGDVAKRRAVVINTLLGKPSEFQKATPDVTQGLISRNADRIKRFANTLRNKGKLHPQIAEIIYK